MRSSLLVAAGFAFVVSSAVAARSQEADPTPKVRQTLINDVETKAAVRSRSKPADVAEEKANQAAAKEGGAQDAGAALPATLNEALAKAFFRPPMESVGVAAPATLDEALAKALRSNPEVLLAEATVRQAQAEYNQAKLKAVQDVTVSFHQWKAQQYKVEVRRGANKQVPGSTPQHEIQQLTSALAESEARLAYLLGVGAELHSLDGSARKVILTPKGIPERIYVLSRDSGEPVAKAGAADKGAVEKRSEIPEKYRRILQKPMKVKFTDMSLGNVIDLLNEASGDELPILRQSGNFEPGPLNVELTEELPLQTVLEMVADLTGCMFIFRDYGLLVVPNGSFASRYPRAATIPEDTVGF